jgi:hypothetical protein
MFHNFVSQLNNPLSHSARKTGSESPVLVVQARHAPALEFAYFLFQPE